MGYAYYVLENGREAGYAVEAECDRADCSTRINRGLAYLCGHLPDGHRDPSEWGCGKYFCGVHQLNHDCPNPRCWPDDECSIECENGTGSADRETCEEHTV